MFSSIQFFPSSSSPSRERFSALLGLLLGTWVAAGCGSAGTMMPPSPSGTTDVIVLLASTTNDKLVSFRVEITNVTLTDQKGKQVTLYNNPNTVGNGIPSEYVEFEHLNGSSAPLVTVSIPQGTYTSGAVKVGRCEFWAVSVNSSGGLVNSGYSEGLCGQGTGDTTISMPSPITISGTAMALSLNLQVPQSYTLNGTGASASYSISPVFLLSPAAIASQPTNDQNGKLTGINAQITSISAASSTFVAQTSDGISLTVN